LMTTTRSLGYGDSPFRMIWFVKWGTIKIGCIDVVHAARDGLSQKSDHYIDIAGRPHTNLLPSRPASCMAPRSPRGSRSSLNQAA
jgi:hypothetical protein